MNTKTLNITLPSDIAEALKKQRNKSAFITEAIKERLIIEQSEDITAALKEGYKAVQKEDKILASEWDYTSGDGIA